jgi:murein DD-endopeptidase MepM/ murein hydrolase activator NlpD
VNFNYSIFIIGICGALLSQAFGSLPNDHQFVTAQTLDLDELETQDVTDKFVGHLWLEDTLSSPTQALDEVHEGLFSSYSLSDRSWIRHYRQNDQVWIEERTCPQSPYFGSPVESRITSRYGHRTHPISGRRHIHTGVDYRGPIGEPIHASSEGRVVHVGLKGDYGKTIIINHGDRYTTLYGHLSKYHVRRGQWVHQGQTIGFIGRTGRVTGPHLHFEVRCHNMPIDPIYYLGKQGLNAKVRFLGRRPPSFNAKTSSKDNLPEG